MKKVVVVLAVVFLVILVLAAISDLGDSTTDRQTVMDQQASDFESLADRYLACEKSSLLESDFIYFSERLTEYQLDPSTTNRDLYLVSRKKVERQLDASC